MAIDDNTSYELTGAQVKDLANKIKAKAADNTFVGATSAAPGSKGLVPQPQAGDNTKYLKGDGTWDTIVPSLVEMSYGESSAWAKFIAAYNAGSIVYCRASSNSNPATGTQGRKAFMAYVNNATTPTEVEFQYVRSVSSKTDSQQCDQVFIYKLTNASGGTWTVTTRNMATKINVSGPITKTFTTGANAVVTIGASNMTGATSSSAGAAGIVPAPASGDQDKVLKGDGTWGDALADSGWQTATLASDFAAYNTSAPAAQYRKVGLVVQVKGVVTPTATLAGSSTRRTIFTLPAGYRPSSTLEFICQGSGFAKWNLGVTSAGEVTFCRYGTTGFDNCIPGNWLPFSATFLAD